MAEQSSIDVLMQIVLNSKTLVMAESATDLVPGDPMLKGFTPGQCCELLQFGFAAGIEALIKKGKKTDEETPATAPATAPPPKAVEDISRSAWRTQRDRYETRKNRPDFVDMQPVSYSRIMDGASPDLFKALTRSETLTSITIVKRKSAGSAASGMGYLKLEFKDVLMTTLTWKDSQHLMIETGTFIYRKLDLVYKRQLPNGSLIEGKSMNWTMDPTRTGKGAG